MDKRERERKAWIDRQRKENQAIFWFRNLIVNSKCCSILHTKHTLIDLGEI